MREELTEEFIENQFGIFKKHHYVYMKHIGYWNNDKNEFPEFPFPIERKLNKEEIDKNLEKLNYLFNQRFTVKGMYSGFSTCRICGQHNGSIEYNIRINDIVYISIPEGYLHYIEEHGIEMDETINKVYNFYKNGDYKEVMKREKWKGNY